MRSKQKINSIPPTHHHPLVTLYLRPSSGQKAEKSGKITNLLLYLVNYSWGREKLIECVSGLIYELALWSSIQLEMTDMSELFWQPVTQSNDGYIETTIRLPIFILTNKTTTSFFDKL